MNQKTAQINIAGNVATMMLPSLWLSPINKGMATIARNSEKILFRPAFERSGASMMLVNLLLMPKLDLCMY